MKKRLLEENTIRQFMKLAQLEPLASDFLKEGEDREMEENADAYMEEADVYTEEAEADMEDTDVDMEESESDTEINITPDQARAIIAVADMLKDIMPEMEDEEPEEELDMEEPEAEMAMGAEEEEEGVADMEIGAEEELAEQVMKRVQKRLREIRNK